MKVKDLLREARKSIFSFSSGDASDIVSQLNMQYGLGKIIYALKKRNLDTERTLCVFTPDGGITRNKERWQAGFSYGCLLRWPSEEETGQKLFFPQVKPNACGMLVAKINRAPHPKSLCDRLHQIEMEGLFFNNVSLKLNVGVSNHFIEVCKVVISKIDCLQKDDLVAVIHTSPSEKKFQLYDFDGWYKKGGLWENTPLGPLLVLEGKTASKYLAKYRKIEEYSLEKRVAIAEKLFGKFELISNPTHQGITSDNEVRLGSYKINNQNGLLPVTFRWDLQVHLVSAKKNLDTQVVKDIGCLKKAREKGVLDLLQEVNILPHGGGYQIPFSSTGWSVIENGSKRLFSNKNNGNNFVFSSPSEIPYYYRGLKIAERIAKLKLGKTVVKLKQLYTLKY